MPTTITLPDNNELLRDWRRKTGAVLTGTASTQAVLLVLGDSWSTATYDWLSKTAPRIQQIAGSAGPGFIFIDNGSARTADPAAVSFTRTGPWTDTTPGQGIGFDGCESIASSTASSITWTLAAGVTASAPVLHFARQTAGSIGRYRFNGGAWTTFDSSGASGYATLALAGAPTTAAYSLEVNVLTANADGLKLFGVDFAEPSAVSGIRIHRGSHGGFSAGSYLGASSATNFAAGVSALNPDLAVIFLGTNDQNIVTPAQYAANVQTLITRLRAVRSGMDILLVAPAENLAGRPTSMLLYRDKLRDLAFANRCAFVDLCAVFGESVSEYNDSSPRALFTTDTLHPATAGIQQICAALQPVLLPDAKADFNRRVLRSGTLASARIEERISSTGGVSVNLWSEDIGKLRYLSYGYGSTELHRVGWQGYLPNTWYGIYNMSAGGAAAFTENRNWYVGNGTTDQAGTYGMFCDGYARIGGVSGPTWKSGTAAPTSTEPNGSMYSCTDAGANGGLWQRKGGVWVQL